MKNKLKDLLVVGAGGHAKVILSTATLLGYKILGVVDDDSSLHGQHILNNKIIGDTEEFIHILPGCLESAAVIVAIGDNLVRRKIVKKLSEKGNIRWATLIHPTAFVDQSCKLGEGTVIFAGVCIQPGVTIGDHSIANTGVTIDHDCHIQDFVHIAPGTNLAGEVKVGEGSFVGIGSQVIPGIQIENWITVGAGATVVSNLTKQTTYVGTPAKAVI